MFTIINEIRDDPTVALNYFSLDSTFVKFDCWDAASLKPFLWSEPLARAARHVLNDQGSCQTSGDAYGNNLE